MHRPTDCLVLAFAFLCTGLAGCEMSSAMVRSTPAMALHLDENEMKAEILRHVAVGMPIDEAKRLMQAHGFECCYTYDREGPGYRDEDVVPATPNGVYLMFSKFKPQPRWLDNLVRSDQVMVTLSFEDDKVSAVHVKHNVTCL